MDEKQKVRKKKKVKSKSKKKQLNLEQNDGLVVVVGQAQETTPEVAPEEPTAENVEAPPSQTVEEEPAQKAAKEDETAEDLENVDSDEKAKSKSKKKVKKRRKSKKHSIREIQDGAAGSVVEIADDKVMENGKFIDEIVADPDNDITKEIVAVSNFGEEQLQNVAEDGGMPDSVAAGPHLSRDMVDDRNDAKEDGTPDEAPQKSKSKKKKIKKKSRKSKSNMDHVEKDGTVLAITVDQAEQNQGEVILLVANQEVEQPESQEQEVILLVTDDNNNGEQSGEIIFIDSQASNKSKLGFK